MEAELASYAVQAIANNANGTEGRYRHPSSTTPSLPAAADDSFVSIEDRMTSFDGTAARQTFMYVREGIKELKMEMSGAPLLPCHCIDFDSSSEEGSTGDDVVSGGLIVSPSNGERQNIWRQPDSDADSDVSGALLSVDRDDDSDGDDDDSEQRKHPDETTPLMS